MDFDDVLEEIGEFGRFQITNYLLICLPVLFDGANSLSYLFTTAEPEYRCFVPGCDNEISPNYSASWASDAIPTDEDGELAQCTMYPVLSHNATTCSANEFSSEAVHCNSWVFGDDEVTIVNEWNIMCPENQWMLSLVGTVSFAGVLVGSVIFGILSDRFGRKRMYVFGILLMSVSGIIQAVSTNYIMFLAFAFINAVGIGGVFPLAFTLAVELVGKKKREMTGIMLNYFYAFGEALVGLVAWLSKNWKVTQLVISAPAALFIVYYWMVPESVRWLIAKNKHDKAKNIIQKAAKVNDVELSENLLSKVNEINVSDRKIRSEGMSSEGTLHHVIQICSSKKLIIRSLILLYNWGACAFVYYGLSTNSTSLGGNKYLNYSLVCLAEIPGYTIAWLVTSRFGRRNFLYACLLLCSVTCVAAAFVPKDFNWAQILLFLIGKIGITSSYAVMYIYTAELYPTQIRSFAVGISTMVSRGASMLAPFTPLLAVYMSSLPLLMFGFAAFIACLISIFLPETLGVKLPETIEELINL